MKSVEEAYLDRADRLLSEAAADVAPSMDAPDGRLCVLEAASAIVGGWDLDDFSNRTQAGEKAPAVSDPRPWAEKVLTSIGETPLRASLALAALSREPVPLNERRTTGAFYTDWRLAELLAAQSVSRVTGDGPWIDPACGSGTLLVAAALEVREGAARRQVIAERLVGADLSRRALRGALLSVASLTDDLDAVTSFAERLIVQDSLRSPGRWATIAPRGAALIIGNPPWEKLRVSRHELARSRGDDRHYGQSFRGDIDLSASRRDLLSYIDDVATGMRLQGKGEHDLYKLFLELGIGLTADGGVLAMLVPAGLIRSQGTEVLRRELVTVSRDLAISVLENRARHFAIDTRFKFLSVVAQVGAGRRKPLELFVADRGGHLPPNPVQIPRSYLHEVHGALAIPEVKTVDEWRLFSRLTRTGVTVGDIAGPWRPSYKREVDMTLDQRKFVRTPADGRFPVLEGRHVAQYRWRAKRYVSGEGRAAIWRVQPISTASLVTQWFIPGSSLNPNVAERTRHARIGFCDITGQTNERSLIVARVPADVVCGNKVPTLMFYGIEAGIEDLFLAVANSFIVDWMLRRLVTTTVNFFLMDSLPMPRISVDSTIGCELINHARELSAAEGNPKGDLWSVGARRARVDALVASAWGAGLKDVELVFADFPLLDRKQPPLVGEVRSTVTRDSVLAALAAITGENHPSTTRLVAARQAGATPFVPAEYA